MGNKRRKEMKMETWIVLWVVFAASIIYWDISRHENNIPLSKCHSAAIKVYYDKPMCTQCKLFCEVKK
jgi:hypothetical protein